MTPRFKKLMPQISGLALAGLAFVMVAASIATEPTGARPAAAPIDARQQLLDLDEEWTVAEERRDAAALGRILDDRFVATLGASRTYDKGAFIKLFSGDVDASATHTLTHEAMIIDGDTAVLVGTETAHGTRDGAPRTAVYKYTVTYIYRGGRWRALAEHIVKVPPPQ